MTFAPVVRSSRDGTCSGWPSWPCRSACPRHRRRPRPPPPQAPSVAELAKLVADQGRALEEQKREIAELRKQLEETKQLSLSANNRLEEMAKAAPAPTVSAAVEERLAEIEASVQQIPDVPKDVVSAGDFPGSIRIPGTDVGLQVGGLVRTTAVATLGPLGTEDRFVTSSIPVAGTPGGRKGAALRPDRHPEPVQPGPPDADGRRGHARLHRGRLRRDRTGSSACATPTASGRAW